MITPMDLENKKFSTSMRGYSKSEVDAFMAELVKEYETLYRENRERKDQLESMEDRVLACERVESNMNKTLAAALRSKMEGILNAQLKMLESEFDDGQLTTLLRNVETEK